MSAIAKLLDIQPPELKFVFEVNKQSYCAVHLANVSDQYVAFKVKTTSPKKYSVRPNIGILKPKSTCDFTVTMQAQHIAPSDLQCKDKFLIQSTAVAFKTMEEDIVPAMFTKENGKYIEESKLRVVLISPPHCPVLLPINGGLKQEPLSHATDVLKDKLLGRIENLHPDMLVKDAKSVKGMEDVPEEVVKNVELSPDIDAESRQGKGTNETKLNMSMDIEELRTKMGFLDSKLVETEFTIAKLQEKRTTIEEREILEKELVVLKRMGGERIQVGFPLLFVFAVALISLVFGYLLHPYMKKVACFVLPKIDTRA